MAAGAAQADAVETPLKVFISYRQADTGSAALLLHNTLEPLIGKDNLFMDTEKLKPGMNWRKEIRANANSPGVLLALIGPRWLEALQARSQQSAVENSDDVLRKELIYSLTNEVDVAVIPVLVEGAKMPKDHQLPYEIRALADLQAQTLRLDTYQDDVSRLVDRIREVAADPSARALKRAHEPVPISNEHPEQYRAVAQYIVGREQVVLVLGPDAADPNIKLPDPSKLARDLAIENGYPVDPEGSSRLDLAEVAQYVAVVKGPDDLYRSLREKLSVECDVGEIHRFLARLPSLTEQLGYPKQHQLIVTTSYDTLLEQAFRDIGEPFDLAVYVAPPPSADHKGRFVHVPGGNGPAKVAWPGNEYIEFPFDDHYDLTRSLIVKIYGAVDTRDGWNDNFVVTEDNYIEYLSGEVISRLVPVQILARLRKSHCVFLGYDIREWSRRVFLKRVWDTPITNESWAVQESPDKLEERLWQKAGAGMVTLIDESVQKYIAGLAACLTPPKQ